MLVGYGCLLLGVGLGFSLGLVGIGFTSSASQIRRSTVDYSFSFSSLTNIANQKMPSLPNGATSARVSWKTEFLLAPSGAVSRSHVEPMAIIVYVKVHESREQ